MGIISRVKTWWMTRTTTEKICLVIGGISTVASVTTAILASNALDDIQVNVNLYPNGKDDPNPIPLLQDGKEVDYTKEVPSPADDGRYDPYELSRDLFNLLDNPKDDDILSTEEHEEAKVKALQLAWALAAREGKVEKANDEIPYQVYD